MKILILSDDFPPVSFGGAGIIAYNHARALLSRGDEVVVITSVQDMKLAGLYNDNGLTVHRIFSNYKERWRAYKSIYNFSVMSEFRAIISQYKPDIVHAHNIHTHLSYASLGVSRKYSKGLFLTFHDAMSVQYGKVGASVNSHGEVIPRFLSPLELFFQYKWRYNPLRNILIKYYLRNVSQMFSVSEALKKVLYAGGIKNVEVLHNGIDVAKWRVNSERLNGFMDSHNLFGKKVILFAGRLTPSKGGDVAFEVFIKLCEKLENIILLVAGNKSDWADKILEKARVAGLGNRIVFTGWLPRDDMPYVYASSNLVLVLSQYVDPFPTNNLEAMASKKPVIGSMFGGTCEVVEDGVTGYIVNPQDRMDVVNKTMELLSDPDKSTSFGFLGEKRVREEFDEGVWVGKMQLWYAKYIK